MKEVRVLEVRHPADGVLLMTMNDDEARRFAQRYYTDHNVICEMYEHTMMPTDHTKK